MSQESFININKRVTVDNGRFVSDYELLMNAGSIQWPDIGFFKLCFPCFTHTMFTAINFLNGQHFKITKKLLPKGIACIVCIALPVGESNLCVNKDNLKLNIQIG